MAQDTLLLSEHFRQVHLADALVTPSGTAVQKRLGDLLVPGSGTGGLPVGTTPGTVAAGDDARIAGAQNAAQVAAAAAGIASAAVAGEATARAAADAALTAALGTKLAAAGGDASATLAVAAGSPAARTLASRGADLVNVLDFGAKGDGTTDDTAALQAAFNRAGAVGGTVYFPTPGPYLISSGLVAQPQAATGTGPGSDIHFLPGIKVINVLGAARPVIRATAAMAAMLTIIYNPNLPTGLAPFHSRIEGLVLDGAGLAATGLVSNYAIHLHIERNAISGTATGIAYTGYGGATMIANVIRAATCIALGGAATFGGGDSLIQHNDFYPNNGTGTCIGVDVGPWGGNTEIAANAVTRDTANGTGTCIGVRLSGDYSADGSKEIRNVVIDANEFHSCDVGVVGVSSAAGRTLWSCAISGNHTLGPTAKLADLTRADDFLIRGNHGNAACQGPTTGAFIAGSGCNRLRIEGNTAANFTGDFAYLGIATDCEINNNTALDMGRAGPGYEIVALVNGSTRCRVWGNHFIQTSPSFAQTGVAEGGGSDMNRAGDNYIVGVSRPYAPVGPLSAMRRVEFGTAAPSDASSYYNRGDIVNNTAPSASAPSAWICTASGAPGTWIASIGPVGTTAGTLAAGDDSRITGALPAATAASLYAALGSAPAFAGAVSSQPGFNAGTDTAGGAYNINAPATQSRLMVFTSASSARWKIGVLGGTESGGNAGSDFIFNRYSDAGGILSTALGISRATGLVSAGNGLAVTGNVGFYGTTPVARPSITGSRTGESAASASIRAALVALGLATDTTTA